MMQIEDVIIGPNGEIIPAPPPPPQPKVNTVHIPADTSVVWCSECQNDTGIPQCQAGRTRVKQDPKRGWFRNTPCNVFEPKRTQAAPPSVPIVDSEIMQLTIVEHKGQFVIQVPKTMWMFFDTALRKGAQALGAQIQYVQAVDGRTRGRKPRKSEAEVQVGAERPRKRRRTNARVSGVSSGIPDKRVRRPARVPKVSETMEPDPMPHCIGERFGGADE